MFITWLETDVKKTRFLRLSEGSRDPMGVSKWWFCPLDCVGVGHVSGQVAETRPGLSIAG